MRTLCVAAALSASLFSLLPAAARADLPVEGAEAPATAAAIEPEQRNLSITLAPALFSIDMVEVMGEVRAGGRVSFAGIVGCGAPAMLDGTRLPFGELGGQARMYLLGGFDHGLALGAQAEVAGGRISDASVKGWSTGLEGALFLGYKIVFGVGLTLDLEAGAQAVTAQAFASNDLNGKSAAVSGGGILPMARLNLGWTF